MIPLFNTAILSWCIEEQSYHVHVSDKQEQIKEIDNLTPSEYLSLASFVEREGPAFAAMSYVREQNSSTMQPHKSFLSIAIVFHNYFCLFK